MRWKSFPHCGLRCHLSLAFHSICLRRKRHTGGVRSAYKIVVEVRVVHKVSRAETGTCWELEVKEEEIR